MPYDTKSAPVEMRQWTIMEIVQFNRDGHWCANPEYHSDRVWSEEQMRLFIDSILRGYYISPIFVSHDGDIMDGYQRVKAMRCFVEGDDATSERGLVKIGALYAPRENPDMPEFSCDSDRECWWGGKKFIADEKFCADMKKKLESAFAREKIEFSSEERGKFMSTRIQVALVGCKPEKARDMFIRLQRGKPLEPQDIRDTRPGKFSDLEREVGGMLEHEPNGYKPHGFFRTGGRGSGTARRKWISEVAALQLSRMGDTDTDFVDIRSRNLDYYARSKFAHALPDGGKERIRAILDKLEDVFPVDKRERMLKGDIEVISVQHLFLLVDMLMDNYTSDWEEKIVEAHTWFAEEAGKTDEMRKQGKGKNAEQDFLTYCESVAKNSDAAHVIRRRHIIYARKMLGFMVGAVKWAHSEVPYRRAGMEFVFYRDNGKCHKCGRDVKWADAEIHPPLNGNKQQPPLDKCALAHKGECPQKSTED